MKKLFLLTVFVLLGNLLKAQPWMPSGNPGPVKFSDIVAAYPKHSGKEDDQDMEESRHGKVHKEGANYLFDRWAWYWRQHLDTDGYIVPSMKTLIEWQKYMETIGNNNVASKTTSYPSNWLFQGPAHSAGGYAGIGRINVIAFDPVDSNTFYIGSAAGSTWKTTNGGNTWVSLYDYLPTLGVADIKINPLNHNTIYVATGDGDASDAYSSGVIKSYDGGNTWLTTGLNWLPTLNHTAHSLLINPIDTNTMILATNAGIYITHDAGNNWTNVTTSGVKQILYNPGDTNIIYGTSTLGYAQIIRSQDGGNTWNNVTSFTGSQRINIAVSPANSAIVTAVVAKNSDYGLMGVYRSVDTGATFTPVFADDAGCTGNLLGYDIGLPTSNCGGQGWYDLCIAMDPVNANNVIIGGVNTYYSYDGGVSWSIANQWWNTTWTIQTVHADKHFLAYNNLTSAVFETCDGGVYKCYGPITGAWTDLSNGISITEFYKNAVADGVPFCIGGAQDNGTKMVNGSIATDLTGGDGMQCRIDYSDPTHIFYSSYPNGAIDMTTNGGTSYSSITNSLTGSGDWVTPYIIHPSDPSTLLLGYDRLYVSHDYGNSWLPASPVFATGININTIAVPFTNTNYIYVVLDNNTIRYSTNFGTSWSLINSPTTGNISDLAVDPKNENHFWITLSGYGSNKVFGYNLTAGTWTNETGTLPNIPVNCILIDSFFSTKYIGTDAAVFYKTTTMSDWALFNTHLPSVRVSDLNINYSTGEIWAATFGRGMWKTTKADLPNGLPSVPLTAAVITVFPDPNHGIFTINTNYKELKGQSVTIKLMAPDGSIAWQKEAAFDNAGDLKINAHGLSKGIYICVASNKNMITRCRVVVY